MADGFKYQVVKKLAEGAVAEVFLARAAGSTEDVVLKVLRPELTSDAQIVGRFLDESKLCQTLDHPNIVKHLGAGQLPDGRVYLLTEYLEGEDLGSRLRTQGPLPAADLARLIDPLCSALAYVHKKGIVHRDIKPDNIFLKDGLAAFSPRLIDFGLALFLGPKSVRTAAGVIVATPEYTPPECISGQKADARSDIYALGILIYEALTGSPPFVASSYSDLLLKHLNEPPPALPAGLAHLNEVVQRCLAKKPEDRFQSAEEVADAIASEAVSDTMIGSPVKGSGVRTHPGGIVVGSYQIIKMIGEGAMGQVYLAKHTRLGRQVALKMLRVEHAQNPQLVQRFFQEAQTVNQINHEHIVEIFDFIEDQAADGTKRAAFVMELLSGSSLSAAAEAKPISLARLSKLMAQVCSALEAAHKVGVVHRDVKPDNIFVTERSAVADFVKVLDFGVAKLVRPIADAPSVGTMEGVIIGTPAYMAPEQASGRPADFRADIYGVGVVLYELLTGKPPFEGEAFGHLIVQIVTAPPPPLPEKALSGETIPEGLKALVMKCLAKEPDQRPASMAEIGRTLTALSPERAEPDPEAMKKIKGSRWPVLAAGAAVAALAVGGWAVFLRPSDAAPAIPDPVVAAVPIALPTPTPTPDPTPAPPAVPPPPAVVAAKVTLSVRSEPAGAKVVRTDNGQELGVTPMTVEMDRAAAELTLRLALPGHEEVDRTVRLDSNAQLDVIMTAQQARAVPASDVHHPGPKKKKEGLSHDGVLDPFN